MRFIAIGYPDEENLYHQHHTRQEEWQFSANSLEEAKKKAYQHFYYFHEVGVWPQEDNDK